MDALARLTTVRLAPFAVCACRVLLAAAVLANYLADYSARQRLWGPDAVYPRDLARADHEAGAGFNLFLLSDAPWYFEGLFHLGLLTAVGALIGWGGRPVLALCWAIDWSLYVTNPWLLDGGGNVVHLLLPMLLLTDSHRHLSLPMMRTRYRIPGPPAWVATLLHNAGVLAIGLQVCVVYLSAGLFKLQGPEWVNGTALHYILQVPQFYRSGPSDLLLRFDLALALAAYAAVALQVFFPMLVLHGRLRAWAVLAMVGFHVSIAVFMGLTTFALTMIAADLVFVDRHVERGIGALRRRRRPPWLRRRGHGSGAPGDERLVAEDQRRPPVRT